MFETLLALTNVEFLAGADNSWAIGNFLEGATDTIEGWLGSGFILVGVIMVAVGAWQAVSKLMSSGQNQNSYPKAIITILIGGAMSFGGYKFIQGIAEGGKQTIENLPGTIIFSDVSNLAQSFIPFF